MARPTDRKVPFPSRETLLDFIASSEGRVDSREISRAFGLRGADRSRLRQVIRELRDEGLLERDEGRGYSDGETLPNVLVLEVSGSDPDGELLARPLKWRGEDQPPRIFLAPERRGRPALEPGDRVLARLQQLEPDVYEARPIRVLGGAPKRLLGIYDPDTEGGRLRPTDRRAKRDFRLKPDQAAGAEPGELVLAEVLHERGRLGLQPVKVVERLGKVDETRALSLIAIQEHDLPSVFPPDALAQADAAEAVTDADMAKSGRVDLRDLNLVTIDGADARDFDDAVWAEPDDDPRNAGGWHLIVAIADVAHYVPEDSPLDQEALRRGNSAYFPDRVVPMLPEALSNGWCSLRPGEDRPCLAADLWIDAEGRLLRHGFRRGLMRSAARLTYEQVQDAWEGRPDDLTAPLLEDAIKPLYGAFEALSLYRETRGVLDLDLPERRVRFDEDGRIAAIEQRERLDSHRLIEEFMITANVAAAEALEGKASPCLYRVHDRPDPQKLEALRQVLRAMELSFPRGQVVRPEAFNRVLDQVAKRGPSDEQDEPAMVSRLILQAQSQAVYAPRNIGHFGLALRRYAHFTSPIRRYADLVVHRSLIEAFDLGSDGLSEAVSAKLAETGRQVSMTERRAQVAERDTLDRFAAAFLKDRIGGQFTGRVTGVTRFGLFVSLEDSGADGLIPVSTLPDDYYDHDSRAHALVGRRWGRSYGLGQALQVTLSEADPITGGLVLTLAGEETTTAGTGRGGPRSRRPAPDRRRGRGGGRSRRR